MLEASTEKVLQQLAWDYHIPPEDIELVLKGESSLAGHYTRKMLFKKIIESYSWFTVLQLFSLTDIQTLLTDELIQQFRSSSLRKQYGFIQKRLQQIIPAAR